MPDQKPILRLAFTRSPLAAPANDAPPIGNLRRPGIDLVSLRRVAILGKIS